MRISDWSSDVCSSDLFYNPMIGDLRTLEIPVIAAVNGVAAGAGSSLALACDLVLAARSASFVQAFSRIGLIPDAGGSALLPRLVGQIGRASCRERVCQYV